MFIQNYNKDSLLYGYADYQGSLTALTDANGNVLERYAYDPWGQRRDPDDWTQTDSRTGWLLNRGYTSHEQLDVFGIINMNGRVYDPLTGMFFSPDPYVQASGNWLNYNRYSYCLNNPLVYTDPSGEFIFTILAAIFCPPLLPVAIGTDIGWISGGIRGAQTPGMNFWDGAWRGGITGAVGGALSMVGGAGMSFAANLGLGTAEGAFTGGLSAALWGDDVGKGMLWGAAGGALMTTVTSENMSNLFKGEGFYTNENVFNNMMGKGLAKQDILDYFGFEGTYDPTNSIFNNNAGAAAVDPTTGNIFYNEGAFNYGYDRLNFNASHELIHSKNVLSGKYEGIKIDFEIEGKEEWSTYLKNYKNQGFYPNHGINIIDRITSYGLQGGIYEIVKTPTGGYSTKFNELWWHFIYRIPKRF